jgi:hypothetical protein
MKQQYRIRNWSEYNAALRQRGSLTFWVSQEALDHWLHSEPPKQLGAPKLYSDLAILSVLTVKSVFDLAGRQASGFVCSVFELMGVELPVPDHSTVSRWRSPITFPV